MDPARFRTLIDVVGEALERAEPARTAWLEDRCAGDPELLHEARALLALARAGEAAGEAARDAASAAERAAAPPAERAAAPSAELDAAPAAPAAAGREPPAPSDLTVRLEAGIARAAARVTEGARPVPERIGPYRVLEVLGEGGMGVVYGARQEEPIRRDVAVKVVPAGIHAPRLIARFEAERRTLASLDHPFIARVFDAGQTGEGLPYLAMEWVHGEPITRFCDARGLSLEARLRLFRKVLDAVQHAHQKGVMHRDLKPSNVLVSESDGEPRPRIIDFGIAKVTEPEPGMETGHTALGSILGTLEYMSPEQATGTPDAVDIRSDVYSLGVMLYELVTGTVPFPSFSLRASTPSELERKLRHEEPPAPSRRVLAGQRARALRGGVDNIVMKAMRKEPAERYDSVAQLDEDIERFLDGRPVSAHPPTLRYRARRFVGRRRAAVLGVSAAVLVLVTSTALFTARLAEERDRARLEAEKATQVADFLRTIFQLSDPWEAQGQAVTARELLDEASGRIERELGGQDEVQATLMRVIGDTYRSLGMFDAAVPLLRGALARHRALHGDVHEEVAASAVALSLALSDMGDLGAAEPLVLEALETRRRLRGPDDPRVSETLGTLAQLRDLAGDRAGAEALFREALAVQERTYPAGDPQLASTRVRLGALLRRDGRLHEAEPLLRAGLAAQRAHYGESHPRLVSAVRNLAALLRDRGGYEEADALYREALALRRRILGDSHPDLATTLSSYALLRQRMEDVEGAIEALTEAVAILERYEAGRTEGGGSEAGRSEAGLSEAGRDGGPHPALPSAAHNLGIQLRLAGRPAEAEDAFRRSMAAQDHLLPAGHPDRAFPRVELSGLLMEQGRHEAALPLLREALALRREGLSPGHRRTGEVLSELGGCLLALGRPDEAEPLLVEGHRILLAERGDEAPEVRTAAQRLADARALRGG